MRGRSEFDNVYHSQVMSAVRQESAKMKGVKAAGILRSVRSSMSKLETRKLDYLQELGTGVWLSTIPSYSCGTFLSASEFRDELRDRYGLPLLNAPSHCDGCNAKFSTAHALSCKVGGLIHQRHDESRDSIICLASAGFLPSNVRDEPIINPCRDSDAEKSTDKMHDSQTGLTAELNSDRGDILIRGFWSRDADCIVDVRICDVNQPSYVSRKPEAVIKSAENEKKKKYLAPCLEQRRHFTPFIASCEGMMGKEADTFIRRLAQRL